MGEAVVKGNFADVRVKRLMKLEPARGSCQGFADVEVRGIVIKNLCIFKNEKEGILFVRPPQQKGKNNKYYDLVNFGNISDDVYAVVLQEFKK